MSALLGLAVIVLALIGSARVLRAIYLGTRRTLAGIGRMLALLERMLALLEPSATSAPQAPQATIAPMVFSNTQIASIALARAKRAAASSKGIK